MSRGCERVSVGSQKSPVVSSEGGGDVMLYLCNTDGGVGDSCTVTAVRDCALHSSVNLNKGTKSNT